MILNNKLFFGWRAAVVLAAAAVCFTAAQAAEGLFAKSTVLAPPSKPMKIPDFDFANLQGGTLNSAELKGRVIVIRFWATW